MEESLGQTLCKAINQVSMYLKIFKTYKVYFITTYNEFRNFKGERPWKIHKHVEIKQHP